MFFPKLALPEFCSTNSHRSLDVQEYMDTWRDILVNEICMIQSLMMNQESRPDFKFDYPTKILGNLMKRLLNQIPIINETIEDNLIKDIELRYQLGNLYDLLEVQKKKNNTLQLSFGHISDEKENSLGIVKRVGKYINQSRHPV